MNNFVGWVCCWILLFALFGCDAQIKGGAKDLGRVSRLLQEGFIAGYGP